MAIKFKNGAVPAKALRGVGKYQADVRVANAYDRLAAAAKKAGHTITVISGYRNLAEQSEVYANRAKYKFGIAKPGSSTHGLGTALDIVATDGAGRAWLWANAKRFGFSRPLAGAGDVNHFQHNLKTAISAPKAVVKKAVAYANSQKLKGPKSAAAYNGVTGPVSNSRIKQLAKRDGLTGYPYATLYQIYSKK